ncbi:MAG: lytic murein transglycosylase [Caldimonas sp.]
MHKSSICCAFVAALLCVRSAAAQDAPTLAGCVDVLRQELPAHPDVRAQTFETYTRDIQDLRPLIEKASQGQPEFQLPIWDYLARRTDAQRVAQGRALLAREATALDGIAKRYGIDPATTVAVFGVETDYGRVSGVYPVVDATLSRACLNLQSTERKQHFFAALRLLQEGIVQRDEFKGSWAGAFGMTQFMPGTFLRHMNDGTGTPPADIIHSVPDALATTARYLRGLGWVEGLPWAIEVKAPEGLDASNALEADHACLADATPAAKCRSVAQWSAAGVVRVDGTPLQSRGSPSGALPSTAVAALLMPAGSPGPVWLVTSNYQAIWRYNRADAYALAIGLLSNALRGLPPQQVAWPTDDPGLSRAEFVELQALLLKRGHCDVRVDGADGPRTGAAVREEERRFGWSETGRSGSRLLVQLRRDADAGTADCSVPAAPVGASAPASASSAPR